MPRPTVTDMTDEQFAEYVKSGAAAREQRANLDRMFAEMYPEAETSGEDEYEAHCKSESAQWRFV